MKTEKLPKVTQTRTHENYNTSQYAKGAGALVAEGKIVLVKNDGDFYDYKIAFPPPIIISETEKIEVGDWVLLLDSFGKPFLSPQQWKGEGVLTKDHKKILVLPEQFSPNDLQAIVDGKMKDGDKVLVECEKVTEDEVYFQGIKEYQIKLNSQGHVTLHKVEERLYTREEVHQIACDSWYARDIETLDFEEWFEQNVK
jgi:hypothetical protein